MGLNINGKPNKINSTYQQMTGVRELYMKKHVQVLNIIGDGDSTYKVETINGKNAQHSKLHENAQVDQALIKFLWNK
ncbi:alpha/beta hydrolase [Lactobacillus crispatus]|nr:alpha/beta hydrolase [Lactobacillus crispatus]